MQTQIDKSRDKRGEVQSNEARIYGKEPSPDVVLTFDDIGDRPCHVDENDVAAARFRIKGTNYNIKIELRYLETAHSVINLMKK